MTDVRTFADLAARAVEPVADKASEAPRAPAAASSAIVLRLDRPLTRKNGLSAWKEHSVALIATQKWEPVAGCFGLQVKLPKGSRIALGDAASAYIDALRISGVISDIGNMRRLEIVVGFTDFTTLTIKPLPDYEEARQ